MFYKCIENKPINNDSLDADYQDELTIDKVYKSHNNSYDNLIEIYNDNNKRSTHYKIRFKPLPINEIL